MLKFLSKAAFYLRGKEPFLNNRDKQICRTSALLFGSTLKSAASRLLFARPLARGATEGGAASTPCVGWAGDGAGIAHGITDPEQGLPPFRPLQLRITRNRREEGGGENEGGRCVPLPADGGLFGAVSSPELCPDTV